jgi:CBS domain-containing protein
VLAINLSLLIFNMVPAFPMDGGRVLRALLAMRMRYGRATQVAAMVGKVIAVLFGVFGIASGNFSLTLVAIFVFMGAGAENQDALLREQLRDVTITEALDREAPVLSATLPAYVAFERLLRSPYRALALVDDTGEYVGMVTRGRLQRLWSAGVRGDLVQFVEPTDLRLDCDASLDAARIRMAESNAPVAPVFCGARFAGLLDIESIGRIVMMRQQGYRLDSRTTT